MNCLNNTIFTFIKGNSDENLVKAIDKSGLVQVEIQVQGKTGIFTRKQWKKVSDIKSTDKVVSATPTTSADISNNAQNSKQKVQELTKGKSVSEIVSIAKSQGITWKENDHEGINLMRCKMAMAKAISEGKWKYSSKDSTTPDSLTDIVGSVKAKLEAQKQQPTSNKDTNDSFRLLKSKEESEKFGTIIKSATDEELLHYRTLGMCASDSDSAQYLARLYSKYSLAIDNGTTNKNINLSDPLMANVQGIVNKDVAKTVKNSIVGVKGNNTWRKRSVANILDNWHNPNGWTSEDKAKLTKDFNSLQIGGARKSLLIEKNRTHTMLYKILEKLDQHPDYHGVASEYKGLIQNFSSATKGDEFLQQAIIKGGSSKSVITNLKNKIKDANKEIDELNNRLNWITTTQNKAKANNSHVSFDFQSATAETLNKKKILENKIKLAEASLVELEKNPLIIPQLEDTYKQLLDDKYEDLIINLNHMKTVSTELTRQYFVTKNFINEYPILSHSNINKLNTGDNDAIVNLSLHAGTFKPTLSKKGDATKAISEKYAERKVLLDTYGGVTSIATDKGYAEDNEIKCKISKASDIDAQRISSNIAKDWDKSAHGNMHYVIKGIYQISDLPVEDEFNRLKAKNSSKSNRVSGGKNCKSDMFYHGTGSMATSLILGHSGAFKVVKAKVGRMLGDGIYLADKSSKSAQYISDSGYSRSGIEGSLMIVEATLGNVESGRHSDNNPNYDSVYAGTEHRLLNKEWCVHNPNAVIPRFLVEMEIK